jgi:hypothetical protein
MEGQPFLEHFFIGDDMFFSQEKGKHGLFGILMFNTVRKFNQIEYLKIEGFLYEIYPNIS